MTVASLWQAARDKAAAVPTYPADALAKIVAAYDAWKQIESGSLQVSAVNAAGDTVRVSWTDLTPNRFWWIALMRKGPDGHDSMYVYADAVNAATTFFYWLDGTKSDPLKAKLFNPPANPGPASGSIDYKLPNLMPSGQYFLRLWQSVPEKYNRVSSCPTDKYIDSPVFSVAQKTPTLALDGSLTQVTKASGSAVAVAWDGVASPSVNDYFILYPVGRPMTVHDVNGLADGAPLVSTHYAGARWHWCYADGTQTDNLITAPRGQASGNFSFPIPEGLIEGEYILYMVRDRLGAGYTNRRICAHSAPIEVTGVSYPADYPLIFEGPFAPPDLMTINCTDDSVWGGNAMFRQTRPMPLFIGHHDYGNDGLFNYVRVSSLNHHNFFEIEWHYTGPEVTETFCRYMMFWEDSFPDCIRPDGGGVKFPGGMGAGRGETMLFSDRSEIAGGSAAAGMLRQPGLINQTTRITNYLQWLGPNDVGYGHSSFPGAPGTVNGKGYTAAHVGGIQRKRWYGVELRQKRNSVTNGVGNADGETDMWIEGHLIGQGRGITWTHKTWSQYTVPLMLMATVFHGGTKHIACPQGYVRLADLAWSTKRIGPRLRAP